MGDTKTIFDLQNGIFSPFSKQDRNRTRRVAFYGRVSTEHEAQLAALENQIQWYDDQARSHSNWIIVDKYIDEGITGTQAKKRPAFLKMLEDARSDKFDLIVTREVCRFARNTVDTLVVTRELKNLGIEVYFVEDNIWTLDGDGELRLTIMATLAQEESRKVSERVKAGQHITREKGIVYGNGNILGYDHVGHTYVINKEQAETVRMIFDLYLQGEMGGKQIANEMIKRGRLTAAGTTKWTFSIITRVLKNATYMGVMAYGKSFSNNYLEQKRINNHNAETYLYKKADFEPIVTEDEFRRVQEIMAERVRKMEESRNQSQQVWKGRRTIGVRRSTEIWAKRLRCGCGSSMRKNVWHKNLEAPWSYGYECYNKVNNGSATRRRKLGQSGEGYCNLKMVADWKLEFMASEIFRTVWKEKRDAISEACDIIKVCYRNVEQAEVKAEALDQKLLKVQSKIRNLRDMRMEGDIDSDDFHDRMKKLIDEENGLRMEINNLTQFLAKKEPEAGPDMDAIKASLERITDFSEGDIDRELIDVFVPRIIAREDGSFIWYLNLSGKSLAEISAFVEGRKNKATVSLTDIMEQDNFFV